MVTVVNFNANLTPIEDAAVLNMYAMHHATYDPSALANFDSLEIVDQPLNGRAVVQKNGTIVVNMDGSAQEAFTDVMTFNGYISAVPTLIEITINCAKCEMAQGWGQQRHFLHPLDTDGKWISLKGEGHKDWYVDDNDAAATTWTLQEIATAEGVGLATITGNWLISNHPTYGGSAGSALAIDAANKLNNEVDEKRRHYTYHLNRGGDYKTLNDKFGQLGVSGVYISKVTSYGTGALPLFPSSTRTQNQGSDLLWEELDFDGGRININGGGRNIAANKCVFGNEVILTKGNAMTLCNVKLLDATQSAPADGALNWLDARDNKKSGTFCADTRNILAYCTYADHCGYGYNYQADGSYIADRGDQPPSLYNHGFYLQGDAGDHSVWNCMVSRNASQGLQNRPGGSMYENAHWANPIQGGVLGQGISKDPFEANLTLAVADVSTQGLMHSPVMSEPYNSQHIGGEGWGLAWSARQMGLVDTVSIHVSDPDPLHTDATVADSHGIRREESGSSGPFFPGSTWLVYRWEHYSQDIPDTSQNIITATMDSYSLQHFADIVLSRTEGVTEGHVELCEHVRGLEDMRAFQKQFVDYFHAGAIASGKNDFTAKVTRATPRLVTAVLDPQGRSSGKWWFASIDWDGDLGDYPGYIDNDDVDLDGHRFECCVPDGVVLNDVDFGDGGSILVGGSSMEITGTMTGTTPTLSVDGNAVLKFAGYSGSEQMTCATNGGLWANTGTIAGNVDLEIEGTQIGNVAFGINPGYALLASGGNSMTFGNGDSLIVGGRCFAALDGTTGTTATVTFAAGSTLLFRSSAGSETVKPGVMRAFKTGLYTWATETAPHTSVVNLTGATVTVDITGLGQGDYVLIDVDTLTPPTGSPEPTYTGTSAAGAASSVYAAGTLTLTIAAA